MRNAELLAIYTELAEIIIIFLTDNFRGADAGQDATDAVRYVPRTKHNRLRVGGVPTRIYAHFLCSSKHCGLPVVQLPLQISGARLAGSETARENQIIAISVSVV